VRLGVLIFPVIIAVPFMLGQESEKNAERNREAQESSSRAADIDISAPKDDAKSIPTAKPQ